MSSSLLLSFRIKCEDLLLSNVNTDKLHKKSMLIELSV